jgi:hypothetical protein
MLILAYIYFYLKLEPFIKFSSIFSNANGCDMHVFDCSTDLALELIQRKNASEKN